jgi:hypothetical protein
MPGVTFEMDLLLVQIKRCVVKSLDALVAKKIITVGYDAFFAFRRGVRAGCTA